MYCCSHCLWWFFVRSLFWYKVFSVLLICNHLDGEERELVALLLFFSLCLVTVILLKLFFGVSWVGLQCVIVALSDDTQLLLIFKVMLLVSINVNKI